MKLRRIVAGMAAAAMALAMSVVAHADEETVSYECMGQIYVQENGGSYGWIGSGENENAKVKPGEEKTITWEISEENQKKMASWIGTTNPPKIGFQLMNSAIAKQEGKEGSMKASSSKITIELNDGTKFDLAGEDLSNDAMKPHDEGGWWSGQTTDTDWTSAIQEKQGLDKAGYEALFPTIKKVTVTYKLDSMTPYEAPTTTPAPSNDGGNTTAPAQTGAAAGIALALAAVAGAGLVVAKKRH